MKQLTIAIAGCGPAGLEAALFLARAGHDIRLYERFAVPKPLGSGLMLQPTGLGVLDAVGLCPAISARGSRITRLKGNAARTGRRALYVSYADWGPFASALAVHRASLFGVLYEAVIAAGIPLSGSVNIASIERQLERDACLMTADGERLGPFDLVIDTLGTRSLLPKAVFGRNFTRPLDFGALWASLPWPGDPGFLEDVLAQRYVAANVMVGVLPIGRRAADAPREAAFLWNLKQTAYAHWRADGLEPWRRAVRAVWPQTEDLLDAITDPDQLVFASYSHHTLPAPIGPADGPAIAVLGDSAHSASPQLGQGANMALIDAWALAEALKNAPDLRGALTLFARMRRRHVAVYQLMSRLFTPFFQSESVILPALRDALVSPMMRLPLVPRTLAKLVAGTLVAPVEGAQWPKLSMQPRP